MTARLRKMGVTPPTQSPPPPHSLERLAPQSVTAHAAANAPWTNIVGTKQRRSRFAANSQDSLCANVAPKCKHPIPAVELCHHVTQRKLLLLLHGAAMRAGGQISTGNAFDRVAVYDQLSVLHALREHAVDHAVRWGFATRVLVAVPTAGWPSHFSAWWQQACHRILGANTSFSPHRDPAGSQVESIYRVLKWAAKSLTWQWDALLMTRPDLMLRAGVPLACNVDAVAGAFETRGLNHFCTEGSWRRGNFERCGTAPVEYTFFAEPADSILWVPAQQHDAFLFALERKLHCRQLSDLHDLCSHVRVRVLMSGVYDANSQKEYNPLYEMSGRPACGINNVCLPSNATAAAVYRRRKRRTVSSTTRLAWWSHDDASLAWHGPPLTG